MLYSQVKSQNAGEVSNKHDQCHKKQVFKTQNVIEKLDSSPPPAGGGKSTVRAKELASPLYANLHQLALHGSSWPLGFGAWGRKRQRVSRNIPLCWHSHQLMLVTAGLWRSWKLAVSLPLPIISLSPEVFMASLESSPISENLSLGVPLERSNTFLFFLDNWLPPLL